jgi:hypothetical protein
VQLKVEASQEEENWYVTTAMRRDTKSGNAANGKKEKGKKKKEAQKQDIDSDNDVGRITSAVEEMVIIITAKSEGNEGYSCSTIERSLYLLIVQPSTM